MIRYLVACMAVMSSLPAASAELEFLDAPNGRGVPIIDPGSCTGGLRNDDGSYEGGVGFANAVPNGAYVMAFDLPREFTARSVCFCWTRSSASNGTAVDFDAVFYAADGVGPEGEPGYPGTLLGFVPARAENVPDFNNGGVAMYRVELPASLPQPLPTRVFVGALWEPFVNRQFFLCNDSTPETPLHEAYNSIDGVEWDITSDIRPTYRALGTVIYGSTPPRPVPLPAAMWMIGLGIVLSVLWIARRKRATSPKD